jgi:hypothetical protein
MYSTSRAFYECFGGFYATWQSVEITMDWTIGQFLGVSYEDTHLITTGMQFGRKAMLLRALVNRSDCKNKGEIIACRSFFVEQARGMFLPTRSLNQRKRALPS